MRAWIFYMIVLVVAATDQLSKWNVSRTVPPQGVPIIYGFFSLTPTRNSGGAFSLFQAHPWVFVSVAVVAIVALVLAYHLRQHNDLFICGALALALGGAIGNLIDRAALGYVRDFFHLHDLTGRTLWPIFNIADSAITVAVVLLVYRTIFARKREQPQAAVTQP